jgi:hypothetical protein
MERTSYGRTRLVVRLPLLLLFTSVFVLHLSSSLVAAATDVDLEVDSVRDIDNGVEGVNDDEGQRYVR